MLKDFISRATGDSLIMSHTTISISGPIKQLIIYNEGPQVLKGCLEDKISNYKAEPALKHDNIN